MHFNAELGHGRVTRSHAGASWKADIGSDAKRARAKRGDSRVCHVQVIGCGRRSLLENLLFKLVHFDALY
jgi:hypothetical protein